MLGLLVKSHILKIKSEKTTYFPLHCSLDVLLNCIPLLFLRKSFTLYADARQFQPKHRFKKISEIDQCVYVQTIS